MNSATASGSTTTRQMATEIEMKWQRDGDKIEMR